MLLFENALFAIVATGGTTNAGIIDDLASIAQTCEAEKIWLHVDCAYGGGALAADSVRHLFNGIEKADSITIDPYLYYAFYSFPKVKILKLVSKGSSSAKSLVIRAAPYSL